MAPIKSKPKRTAPAKGQNQDTTKKRGRPRVESVDVDSASERRRTQIRLAQRAYRERKESTITKLEERLAHFKQAFREMQHTFESYRHRTIASGLVNTEPILAQALNETAQKIEKISRDANRRDADIQAGLSGPPSLEQSPASQTMAITPPQPVHTAHFTEATMLLSQHNNPNDTKYGVLGYRFEYPEQDPQVGPPDMALNQLRAWSSGWPMSNIDPGNPGHPGHSANPDYRSFAADSNQK